MAFDWDKFTDKDENGNRIWAEVSEGSRIGTIKLFLPKSEKKRKLIIAFVMLDEETLSRIVRVERNFEISKHEYTATGSVCMCAMLLDKLPPETPIVMNHKRNKFYVLAEEFSEWVWHKKKGFERQRKCLTSYLRKCAKQEWMK
jgi:hypothetical protein